eukprot:53826-Amphidinium_carterae.1
MTRQPRNRCLRQRCTRTDVVHPFVLKWRLETCAWDVLGHFRAMGAATQQRFLKMAGCSYNKNRVQLAGHDGGVQCQQCEITGSMDNVNVLHTCIGNEQQRGRKILGFDTV